MTKLSRRAALAGAISFAPAALAATVPIGADPDAELIAVGEQLRQLYERQFELRDFILSEKWHTLSQAAIREISELQRNDDRKAAHELAVIKDAEINEAMGPEWVAANREQDQVLDAIDDSHKRMFALPARSIRGLTIKALAAAYWNELLWDDPLDDLDPDKMAMRHLIEEVLALAGEPLPFEAPDASADEEV